MVPEHLSEIQYRNTELSIMDNKVELVQDHDQYELILLCQTWVCWEASFNYESVFIDRSCRKAGLVWILIKEQSSDFEIIKNTEEQQA